MGPGAHRAVQPWPALAAGPWREREGVLGATWGGERFEGSLSFVTNRSMHVNPSTAAVASSLLQRGPELSNFS